MNRNMITWLSAIVTLVMPAASAPLIVPFDFSRQAIGVDVTLNRVPLYVILDTGVDPSVIDLERADALGLKVDRRDHGEADGFGDGQGAAVYPTIVTGLAIHGHSFKPFAALASDMSALSRHYGHKLDAVLGYSFLSDKAVLIDYSRRTLAILATPGEAGAAVRNCPTRWTTPLTLTDSTPIISDFRLGHAAGPISLDTGSNGGIGLFRKALDLPGVRAALTGKGSIVHSGARGEAKTDSYTLGVPVGFGPFTLPAGQVVTVHGGAGPDDDRVANIGNGLFAAMGLKMLLDYRAHSMTFYGDCS